MCGVCRVLEPAIRSALADPAQSRASPCELPAFLGSGYATWECGEFLRVYGRTLVRHVGDGEVGVCDSLKDITTGNPISFLLDPDSLLPLCGTEADDITTEVSTDLGSDSDDVNELQWSPQEQETSEGISSSFFDSTVNLTPYFFFSFFFFFFLMLCFLFITWQTPCIS